MCVQLLIHVQLFVAPWTVAHKAPLSVEFPRQEYWSELPFPTPGDLPNSGIEPASLESPASAGGSLPLAPPRKPKYPQGLKPNSELVGCEYFFSQQHLGAPTEAVIFQLLGDRSTFVRAQQSNREVLALLRAKIPRTGLKRLVTV